MGQHFRVGARPELVEAEFRIEVEGQRKLLGHGGPFR
jgi:hypothetical protein